MFTTTTSIYSYIIIFSCKCSGAHRDLHVLTPSVPTRRFSDLPPVVSPATPSATQVSLQCYAIGPFSDAGKLAAARRQLQSSVERLRTREAAPANAARRE